jgi:hypothetical protein
MLAGWTRPHRALRVLLACALLWLSSGAPVVLVADTRAAVVVVAGDRKAALPAAAPAARALRARPPARSWPRLLVSLPPASARPLAAIERRYLRFCVLLS